MPDLHPIVEAIDYWLERYQTLVIGAAAVVAAVWAVRPAWRQVSILEAQRTDQIRERLAAKYRMLNRAIDRLNPEAWRKAVKFGARPTDQEMEGLSLSGDLMPAYKERVALWGAIKGELAAELSAPQQKLIAEPIGLIDDRFAEIDGKMAWEHPEMKSASGSWFNTCDYPDLIVVHQMERAREILSAVASETVEELVKPHKA